MSVRYFFFIYCFIIKSRLDKIDKVNTFENYDIINNVCNYILNYDNDVLTNGILNIFQILNIKFLLKSNALFKKKNNII